MSTLDWSQSKIFLVHCEDKFLQNWHHPIALVKYSWGDYQGQIKALRVPRPNYLVESL